MALSCDEKLKNFAEEVTVDAKRMCNQMDEQAKKELQEKTNAGKEEISAQTQEFILRETEKIKKEKSLEISKAGTKARQSYFRYGGEVSSRVFECVQKRLADFMESGLYADYLLQCCKNVMQKTKTGLVVYHMPSDEGTMEKVKTGLEVDFDLSGVEFVKDETIKMGGLRFFDRTKNILVNDAFEEKTERAKELLNAIMSPHFTKVES